MLSVSSVCTDYLLWFKCARINFQVSKFQGGEETAPPAGGKNRQGEGKKGKAIWIAYYLTTGC